MNNINSSNFNENDSFSNDSYETDGFNNEIAEILTCICQIRNIIEGDLTFIVKKCFEKLESLNEKLNGGDKFLLDDLSTLKMFTDTFNENFDNFKNSLTNIQKKQNYFDKSSYNTTAVKCPKINDTPTICNGEISSELNICLTSTESDSHSEFNFLQDDDNQSSHPETIIFPYIAKIVIKLTEITKLRKINVNSYGFFNEKENENLLTINGSDNCYNLYHFSVKCFSNDNCFSIEEKNGTILFVIKKEAIVEANVQVDKIAIFVKKTNKYKVFLEKICNPKIFELFFS
ncbi:Hypothetical protein SRAE_1000103300 [Strongyloides ratti]|uniref:Uncharacterized protein n=1 Tax=Strongyloides ratti TaxID=34506 RepID=A0A090MVA3_STRRB|nr:Hypothetical protein SRAE_1000103300 [Strongyloides ratti]CEF62763.1 Hypothetical protein SRAE_1000103300 [Strongyloides ratti]